MNKEENLSSPRLFRPLNDFMKATLPDFLPGYNFKAIISSKMELHLISGLMNISF